MNVWDVAFILLAAAGIVMAVMYFLNKWAYKKMGEQQEAVERNKQTVTIFVIDKSRGKIAEQKFPKAVTDQMPRMSKFFKMYFVKAKIGSQIITLMTEKNIYNALPVKKNVKIDLSGIYISGMKGMKTPEEMKKIAKEKKAKEKAEKKAANKNAK